MIEWREPMNKLIGSREEEKERKRSEVNFNKQNVRTRGYTGKKNEESR